MTPPPGPYRATTCRERELTLDHMHTFLTTQGHGGSPRMRDQLNAGATFETTRTLKTMHTFHAPIHFNKANMKGLWRPNDIRGPCGPRATWHLSYRWGKTPKKPHRGNLSQPGIDTGSGRACYRLLHSSGPFTLLKFPYLNIFAVIYNNWFQICCKLKRLYCISVPIITALLWNLTCFDLIRSSSEISELCCMLKLSP